MRVKLKKKTLPFSSFEDFVTPLIKSIKYLSLIKISIVITSSYLDHVILKIQVKKHPTEVT